MNELPSGWELLSLKDCVFFQEGPGLRKWQFGESGVPFLNIRTFNNGKIDKTKCQFVKLADFTGKYEHFLLEEGDIVVSSSGTLGKLVVVRKQDLPLMLNTSVIRYRSLYPEHLLQSFLKFFLQSHHFFNQISSAKTGSAILNYGPSHLKEMIILVPPVNEQLRIVAKLKKLLSRVDAAQARLATIPGIVKRFRQSVLAAACSGRLTADWREQHPDIELASDLIERIRRAIVERYEKECAIAMRDGRRKPKAPNVLLDLEPEPLELPELPPTWRWSYLQNLGEFTRGKSKHRPRNDPKLFGGEYPFIQTGDVSQSDGRILSHAQTYNEVGLAQSRLFPKGTLCITIAANIAETAILTYPACFPDSVVGFIPEERLFEALWAMYFVRVVQNDLETFAPATAQKNINMDILFKVAIPVPPLAEQQEIVRRVEALLKTADALEARYRTAKAHVDKLTQSILAKAFRGELVPQDPNDEPASVLLERIRQSNGTIMKKRRARR